MSIQRLIIWLNFGEPDRRKSALIFFFSADIFISCTEFLRIRHESKTLDVRALHITYSTVTAANCLFEGNTGDHGGAIHAVRNSSITLINSYFIENSAVYGSGGAIYLRQSTLVANGGTFVGNRAGSTGGAIAATSATMYVNGMILPPQNTSNGNTMECSHGGELCYRLGNVVFSYNNAERGGAIDAFDSKLTFSCRHRSCQLVQSSKKYAKFLTPVDLELLHTRASVISTTGTKAQLIWLRSHSMSTVISINVEVVC